MFSPHPEWAGRPARGRSLVLPLLVLASLALGAGRARGFSLNNVAPVNVTASGFSVIFRASEPITPGIAVYADAAGVTNLAGQVGVELFPVHTGNPANTEAYEQRQSQAAIRLRTQDRGLGCVRITDCQPGTTYYYRVIATAVSGQQVIWPPVGPLPAVTTATANSFVVDSRQLVIDLIGGDGEGQIVTLSHTNSAYALAAVSGDGVGTNQVFFNLTDLLALSGGTNYTPLGDQEFTVTLPGRGGAGGTNLYALTFTTQFVVAAVETEAFVGRDLVALTLGSAVLPTGDTGSISIRLFSTAGLTNLSFTLDLPTNSLVNLALQDLAPVIGSATVQSDSPTRFTLAVGVTPGQSLQGNQPLASLAFTALSNQPSAFISLRPAQLQAARGDGSLVTNWYAQPGRVAVVGQEPLLESRVDPAGVRSLLLYGKIGFGYQLQYSLDLGSPVNWRNSLRVPLTNIVQTVEGAPSADALLFFRAYELPGDPPVLDAALRANGARDLTLYGRAGSSYQLQYTTNLSGLVTWYRQLDYTLTNSFRMVNGLAPTSPLIFYRIFKP